MHDGEQVHLEEPPQNSVISTPIHLKVQCNLRINDTNINNFSRYKSLKQNKTNNPGLQYNTQARGRIISGLHCMVVHVYYAYICNTWR